jgi:hypothetical protein
MKHPLEYAGIVEGSRALLQAALRPDRQDVRIDQVLAERAFQINKLDRLAIKVVESHNRPVLVLERQRYDRGQVEWRHVSSFRLAFAHAAAIHESLGKLLEAAGRG